MQSNSSVNRPIYLDYHSAVAFYIIMMQTMHEKYYGLIAEELLASALERPVMAFQYENANLLRQAAHLLWGIIKNHPFRQGNKRTGVALAFAFLVRNDIVADQEEVIELGLGVAESRLDVDQVDKWLRDHAQYQTPT